jgi:dipeptidyl aminopeptidase/acylaminoacyl peptidase
MAAMGGSFGGYMSNWIATQTTRFKYIVTHASVYSMSAFTGVTDLPAY